MEWESILESRADLIEKLKSIDMSIPSIKNEEDAVTEDYYESGWVDGEMGNLNRRIYSIVLKLHILDRITSTKSVVISLFEPGIMI